MAKKRTNADVYRDVTNRMIEALELGRIPWQKPWSGGMRPMNYISGKAYSGINTWILASMPFESPYWLTYKQAKKLGGNVMKGQKGTKITYWNIFKKEVEDKATGETKKQSFFFLKEFTVFNAEQVEGIEFEEPKKPEGAQTFESAEQLIKLFEDAPNVRFDGTGSRACYSPTFDFITMPNKDLFKSTEGYYSTLFHELAHSTGHESRLAREGVTNFDRFGSHQYSKEELVAEMSACFMMSICGLSVEPNDNSKAYINGWIEKLKNDPKVLFQAAKEAEKASNYMMNVDNAQGEDETNSEAA